MTLCHLDGSITIHTRGANIAFSKIVILKQYTGMNTTECVIVCLKLLDIEVLSLYKLVVTKHKFAACDEVTSFRINVQSYSLIVLINMSLKKWFIVKVMFVY